MTSSSTPRRLLVLHRSCLLFAVVPLCSGCGEPTAPSDVTYPSEPIKIIVPFGAGGGTDSFARIIEKGIEDHDLLPQPVVIQNVGGAGATIGSRRAKDAPPDGHTVLVLHNAILTARFTRLVDYGPEAFEVVAATGFVGQVVAVRDDPQSPKTLDELIERARAKPGTIRWTCNIGALTHFSGLQLEQSKKADGAKFNFVPSGGGADRYAAIKGGHADVTGFSLEEFQRYKSDGLRGLCYLGAERRPELDVPTARELGYTEVVRDNLFYWWMPKGTPRARIERFADALEAVMQKPDVRGKLAIGLIDPVFVRGPELHERLRAAEVRNAAIKVPQEYELPNFALILFGCVAVLGIGSIVETAIAKPLPSVTESVVPETAPLRSRADLAIGTIALVTAYATSLSLGLVDFRIATALFMLLAGGLLVGRRPWMLAGLVVIAVVTSLGLHAVFTDVLNIFLP